MRHFEDTVISSVSLTDQHLPDDVNLIIIGYSGSKIYQVFISSKKITKVRSQWKHFLSSILLNLNTTIGMVLFAMLRRLYLVEIIRKCVQTEFTQVYMKN